MRPWLLGCLLTVAACSFDKPPPVGGDDAGDDDPIDAPPGEDPDAPPGEACTPVQGTPALTTEVVAQGLDMPVFVTSPPGERRLFILEKKGPIRIVDESGVLLPDPFITLDVANVTSVGDERGLLGLAFHPDYATNRKFYVFYSDNGSDTVVEQYLASESNPNVADPESGERVLFLQDPYSNHNGGMIAFGPDGYLYIGIGDGGSGGDPEEWAEDLTVLFGKILRIDVDQLPYTIPNDNPFAGSTTAADEIWSYGLRNPWRWSFDRMTGDMYIGDVGQNAWEEVNVEPADSPGGVHYGWDTREGKHCFEPSTGCETTGRTDPVYEYSQSGGGCTVVGGYVYRGCRMPGHHGTYFFAEYCSGWVRSFEWDGGTGYTDEAEWSGLALDNIVSFGEDGQGELYIVTIDPGEVRRIVPE